MSRPRRADPLMRLTFAVSSADFERIRKTAQKEGSPYTVWARDAVLRAVETREGRSAGPRGKITLSVPFEIRHYDRLRKAAARVGQPPGDLCRTALRHALGLPL